MIATREKPVFTAYNNHTEHCGNPPFFTNRDKQQTYCGYFQNMHGEQLVFIFDRENRQGTLWGGDCGWKTKMPIVEITASQVAQGMFDIDALLNDAGMLPLGDDRLLHVPGVNLSPAEQKWLRACWDAATGRS